ncbi:hypothetical protein ACHAXS_008653 [Conticribra weissflogii]
MTIHQEDDSSSDRESDDHDDHCQDDQSANNDDDDNDDNDNDNKNKNSPTYQRGKFDPLDQSHYPKWDWDRVHSYVAIRRASAYSQQQIEQIAHHDVVMLEKANGTSAYGSVEEGTRQAAARIKSVNPSVKILFYLNSMVHYPRYEANKTFKLEWATRKRENPDEYFKFMNRYYYYDHRNLDFREWWISRALEMLDDEHIDGIFMDGICATPNRRGYGKGYEQAYIETATELRERLPPGKFLIGNALKNGANNPLGGIGNIQHLQYLDGSYLERWYFTPESIVKTMQLMREALKEGRIVMLKGVPDERDAVPKWDEGSTLKEVMQSPDKTMDERYAIVERMIAYPLAIFLLIVEPHAYFSYCYGVNADPKNARNGRAVFDCERFKELKRKLGKAMGPYVKEDEKGEFVFSREFEYLKVWVDIESREVRLEETSCG